LDVLKRVPYVGPWFFKPLSWMYDKFNTGFKTVFKRFGGRLAKCADKGSVPHYACLAYKGSNALLSLLYYVVFPAADGIEHLDR